MALKIIPFEFEDEDKFQQARTVRKLVFVEEQKVDEKDEFDEFEKSSLHYLMTLNNKIIGAARWREVGGKVKLERFAVLKEYRGKKYGDALLVNVLKDAQKRSKNLYLHAQLKAIPFYERRGFKKVGELFVECKIEHYKMELNLD